MIKGFKEFISQGNAIDLAVGVIIGAAFKTIVDALVEKVINPLIGGIFGQPNFDSVGKFSVNGAEVLPGAIITALVNFLLVAFALYFFLVVPMNKLKAAQKQGKEDAPAEPSDEVKLLTEIRDSLAR
ncbi:Large-conductance mechanosensitive channel [Actinomyces bovis]|uniref:Large-conductance mechanosensitive channel n=1 Tax=Actinomyces bovis TaxID=1658 RepID=A0ABY1VQ24_9ACTO|nr:large conductance mechanosensitive channel protein MscL [Actinomyces bovis]SPT54229.1 Large-conductance mechanosensitive channel [Actinomyces bovis]VEG56496.1 Large-conductance mechanosensitive channel [Actinomyces israelii]